MKMIRKFQVFLISVLFLTEVALGATQKRCADCGPATVEDHPYMVHLMRFIPKIGWFFRCNAVMYTRTVALTVNHCFKLKDVSVPLDHVGVLAGKDRLQTIGNTPAYKIEDLIKVVAGFDLTDNKKDEFGLAVLVLEKGVLEDAVINFKPISIRLTYPETYETCQMYTYGEYDAVNELRDLRGGDFMIYDSTLCVDKFQIPRTVICAAGLRHLFQLCIQDSGAPLLCGGKLVGLADGRPSKCDSSDYPGVFIRVLPHVQEIDKIVADHQAWDEADDVKLMISEGKDVEARRKKLSGV